MKTRPTNNSCDAKPLSTWLRFVSSFFHLNLSVGLSFYHKPLCLCLSVCLLRPEPCSLVQDCVVSVASDSHGGFPLYCREVRRLVLNKNQVFFVRSSIHLGLPLYQEHITRVGYFGHFLQQKRVTPKTNRPFSPRFYFATSYGAFSREKTASLVVGAKKATVLEKNAWTII